MKKTILIFTVLSLFVTLSCNKKASVDPNACSAANLTEYGNLLNAWVADPTNKSKCQSAIVSLGKFVDCPGNTAVEKEQYRQLIDGKPCDNL